MVSLLFPRELTNCNSKSSKKSEPISDWSSRTPSKVMSQAYGTNADTLVDFWERNLGNFPHFFHIEFEAQKKLRFKQDFKAPLDTQINLSKLFSLSKKLM